MNDLEAVISGAAGTQGWLVNPSFLYGHRGHKRAHYTLEKGFSYFRDKVADSDNHSVER